MKKIFFSTILFLAIFILAGKIKADVSGWLWGGSGDSSGNSSGIGWISLNSSDSSGITVPSQTCSGSACAVTGYTWSENVGWIDFNSQDHCITSGTPSSTQYKALSCTDPKGGTGGVFRSGSNLNGWARIVSVATANGNSGGEDGWIGMGNADASLQNNGYIVSIDPTTGIMSGYAWAGSTFGAIDFSGAQNPVAPIITLTPSPDVVTLSPGQTLSSATTNLTWSSNAPVNFCTTTCVDANNPGVPISCSGWSNLSVSSGSTSGTASNVPVNATAVNFSISCKGSNGLQSNTDTKLVTVGCRYGDTCNSGQCILDQFVQTTSGDTCTGLGSCTTNDQCKLRGTGIWQEIAP